MTLPRGVGRGARPVAVTTLLIALLATLAPTATTAVAGWTDMKRVTDERGSRLDSLHQLSGDRGRLHLVHPHVGSGETDDRVWYQRSRDAGTTWSRVDTLFSATRSLRNVVPNLALAARADVVAVAWRVGGRDGHVLFVRVSRDGGESWGKREILDRTRHDDGIGVPAIAVGSEGKVVSVAWTDRANGRILLRTSRDAGRTFGEARTLGRTRLSIDCRKRQVDGLVGLAASRRGLHVAWSEAPAGSCHASRIRARSSWDRGRTWRDARTVTDRQTYGWPELEARGSTILATVQATNGGIVLARSGDDGRRWRDRLLRAPRGYSLSAADSVLMERGRAMLTYVRERVRRARLLASAVLARSSPDDGASLRQPRTVVPEAKRLRMAANIAANGRKVTIVLQSGPLSGSPRNVYATRMR
jgi:hypothetical protein